MGNTPSSAETNDKASNQNSNMLNNKKCSSAPPVRVPTKNFSPPNTNVNPTYNQQPTPPGWSIPIQTQQNQQAPAQSKSNQANAQPTAPVNTRIYPQTPTFDSILKTEQLPKNPTAPRAPNYPSPTHVHFYGDASTSTAPEAITQQYYTQPPPQTSQFYAQPNVHAQQPTKYFSQPRVVSGNAPPKNAAASMPFSSASLGLQSKNWVHNNQNGIPSNAFEAGHDTDGCRLFICRALHGGDILPGKVVPKHKCAYVSYNGKEHAVKFYEVLVGNCYRWIQASNGQVPKNAVEGGRTSNGEKLYIGRTRHKNSLTPGKVHPSHKCLYIPYGGEEKHFSSYEVLVHL